MATPAPAPESPPAAEPAPAVGPAGEPCTPRQPQPGHNILAAPRLRAPSSRRLGVAEFGRAAGEVEAPGETFAQRKLHLQIARQRQIIENNLRNTRTCTSHSQRQRRDFGGWLHSEPRCSSRQQSQGTLI
ncbi:DNA-directed RNA polymerase II subunit GRINL1A, isoforms 4/5 [Microtus ochrogaster]|uniref:DNA-directed RNA polymerase II subunit GRINL1A, isoforms 4/5 n=1 Tax=Microtus ochrogaster TaxID=79684 RepID=A0A8J6KZV8_MICOH|nr:DNA-directed RNA polymerase II subunit GRINL1A, isoforms 4/5 [Microtus ochrogaster]